MNTFSDFDQEFARTERLVKRGFKVGIALWVMWVIFILGLIGAGIYVAAHFIAKAW